MPEIILSDYFYGDESEEFVYFKIPRQLITNPKFKHVSTDAKLLYGMLLDRMSLSARNNWYDSDTFYLNRRTAAFPGWIVGDDQRYPFLPWDNLVHDFQKFFPFCFLFPAPVFHIAKTFLFHTQRPKVEGKPATPVTGDKPKETKPLEAPKGPEPPTGEKKEAPAPKVEGKPAASVTGEKPKEAKPPEAPKAPEPPTGEKKEAPAPKKEDKPAAPAPGERSSASMTFK